MGVPETWSSVQLGDVTTQVRERVQLDDDTPYKFVGVRGDGQGPYVREVKLGGEVSASSLYRVPPSALIYCRLTTWKGVIGVTNEEHEGAVVSNEFPLFAPDADALDVHYLNLWFQLPSTLQYIKETGSGLNESRRRWKEDEFRRAVIPLPPLEVQCRIVDLIDHIDQTVDAARIEATAANEAATALRYISFANGGERTPLGEHADVQLGKMLSKAAREGPDQQPYLRNANVQWDHIGVDDLNTMSFDEREKEKFALRAGDVLVCEGGEVGRAAVVSPEDVGLLYQKALHRVRTKPTLAPRFLLHFLRYASDTGGFTDYATTTTIAHLTREKLLTLPVPLPPRDAQDAVVARLDALSATQRRALALATGLGVVRASLLATLLNGESHLPPSYDRFLQEVAA